MRPGARRWSRLWPRMSSTRMPMAAWTPTCRGGERSRASGVRRSSDSAGLTRCTPRTATGSRGPGGRRSSGAASLRRSSASPVRMARITSSPCGSCRLQAMIIWSSGWARAATSPRHARSPAPTARWRRVRGARLNGTSACGSSLPRCRAR